MQRPVASRSGAEGAARCREDAGASDRVEELVRTYQDRVFRLVAGVLGPGFDAEAEEVTQEVFLRVFRRLESFRGESAIGTWLYRIAYNAAVECKRRVRFRHPHVELEALSELSAGTGGDPHESAIAFARGRALRRAIETLPETYQTLLHLHYWLGLGIAEIATCLETPPGTVKSYLHRARRRLCEELEEEG